MDTKQIAPDAPELLYTTYRDAHPDSAWLPPWLLLTDAERAAWEKVWAVAAARAHRALAAARR